MSFHHARAGILPLLLLALATGIPAIAVAQAADPDPARFAEAITRFQRWDEQNAWPDRNVVFVGSSSIVYWPTRTRFPGLPVINRGFGGSHISDVNHFIEETVLRYSPDVVVFYAGNNDIAAGKSPAQVLEDYRRFTERTLAAVPGVQVVFVSIHPSILRWARWPAMREANGLVRSLADGHPSLHYVDISEPMLGEDGTPRPELFVADNLHLSPAGYDVWTPIVARAVEVLRGGAGARR
jgi:lysophospholipase L1-like esterase